MPRQRDDLRDLVENQLPKLAYEIVNSGPRWMYNARDFKNRANWAHDEYNKYSRMDTEGKLIFSHADNIEGTPAYLYRGYDQDAPNNHLNQWWYVAFYNIRLVDIESVDPRPVEVLNPDAVKLISVAKERNNGPSFLDYNIQVTEKSNSETESSFGVTAESEFELAVDHKIKAGIGVAEGERQHFGQVPLPARSAD